MSNNSFKAENIAIIAYLTPIGLIAAYFLNKSQKSLFTSFHIKNMLGICLIYYLGLLFGSLNLDLIHEVFFYLGVFLWIISFIRMLLKQSAGVPFLDMYFQRWFKFLD